jgi:hypothetical protein
MAPVTFSSVVNPSLLMNQQHLTPSITPSSWDYFLLLAAEKPPRGFPPNRLAASSKTLLDPWPPSLPSYLPPLSTGI